MEVVVVWDRGELLEEVGVVDIEAVLIVVRLRDTTGEATAGCLVCVIST